MLESLYSMLEAWQRILKTEHWNYQISTQPPANPDHSMECVTVLNRNSSSIRLGRQDIYEESFARELLHEMIHPILEPIRAEHKLQMKYLDTDRAEEYEKRIYNTVEKVVDHLTNVIYDQQLPKEVSTQASVAQ